MEKLWDKENCGVMKNCGIRKTAINPYLYCASGISSVVLLPKRFGNNNTFYGLAYTRHLGIWHIKAGRPWVANCTRFNVHEWHMFTRFRYPPLTWMENFTHSEASLGQFTRNVFAVSHRRFSVGPAQAEAGRFIDCVQRSSAGCGNFHL